MMIGRHKVQLLGNDLARNLRKLVQELLVQYRLPQAWIGPETAIPND